MKDILIENFLSKYSKIYNSLQESMKEIARKNFASLNKEEDGHYYILVDGNYEKDFYADSDEEAKKKFQQYLRKNESLTEDFTESVTYNSADEIDFSRPIEYMYCYGEDGNGDWDKTDAIKRDGANGTYYEVNYNYYESGFGRTDEHLENSPTAELAADKIFKFAGGPVTVEYSSPLDESLTEARNPEHEKANKIIRKMCGYGELTDKEIQELKRVGIDPKKMTMDRWNDWQIIGPNGRKLTDMSDSLPRILKKTNNNFDIVGYLTKQHDDKEIDPVDALQPYRKEKEAIKKAGESERKAQERKQRAIQAAKEKHQKK